MLQSMQLQRLRHNLATEQQQHSQSQQWYIWFLPLEFPNTFKHDFPMLCTSYNLQYLRPIRLRPVIKNPIECSIQIHINAGVHPYTPPPTYTHTVPIFNLRKLFLTLIKKIFLFLLQSFYNRKITNFCFNPAIIGKYLLLLLLLQSYPTLCDPIDGSPPGSPIPGILQARTLEWVAISFSNAWK